MTTSILKILVFSVVILDQAAGSLGQVTLSSHNEFEFLTSEWHQKDNYPRWFLHSYTGAFCGERLKEVVKWSQNTGNVAVMMTSSRPCAGIFVDIANYLYCSQTTHQVVKQSLDAGTNTPIIVAGHSGLGSTSSMLKSPRGLFVDTNFDLYVADFYNERVQFFKLGKQDGITVAKNGITFTLGLMLPVAVVLDADGYLFITDHMGPRIIGSNLHGFYCVIGCSRENGRAFRQLTSPVITVFDSLGNIFVADYKGIQKFILTTNASS
ncbi:hypothetical protein I4U23_016693, partial [Adineta vaga]